MQLYFCGCSDDESDQGGGAEFDLLHTNVTTQNKNDLQRFPGHNPFLEVKRDQRMQLEVCTSSSLYMYFSDRSK